MGWTGPLDHKLIVGFFFTPLVFVVYQSQTQVIKVEELIFNEVIYGKIDKACSR